MTSAKIASVSMKTEKKRHCMYGAKYVVAASKGGSGIKLMMKSAQVCCKKTAENRAEKEFISGDFKRT